MIENWNNNHSFELEIYDTDQLNDVIPDLIEIWLYTIKKEMFEKLTQMI